MNFQNDPARCSATLASAAAHQVCQLLRGLQLPIYAVLDSARDRRVLQLLRQSDTVHCLLYGSRLASLMDGLGPYLVSLTPESPLLPIIIETGWGKSWGMFIASAVDFNALRRHLRRLLVARLPQNKVVLFRFYDPRVLRVYLANCTPAEAELFFGPCYAVFSEGSSGEGVDIFSLCNDSDDREPQRRQITRHSITLMPSTRSS